jgi:integrase
MAYIQERTNKDGKTHYRVQVRLKGYPTETATFHRKTDAKNWAADTESAMRDGRHFKTSEAKRRTLEELLDRYETQSLSKNIRNAYNQKIHLRWWKKQIGHLALADISPALIAEHRDKLSTGVTKRKTERSPATVNRYLATLSHALSTAVKEWGWLDDTPMRRVTKAKEPRGRVRFLSEDERPRLLDACKKSHVLFLTHIVLVALSTGARKSEIMGLTWNDVNLDRGLVTFLDTKNGDIRTVPLVGLALDRMKELSTIQRIDTKLCFPRKDGKQPLDIRKAWSRAKADAELEDFNFHDLRHSCASYLAMNGATLAEIAEVLGHKTLQMVMRYAHLSEAHTAGVLKRMTDKVFGSEQPKEN